MMRSFRGVCRGRPSFPTRRSSDLDVFNVADKSFAFQDFGDLFFHVGSRNFQLFMAYHVSVTDTRKHICDRITHSHCVVPPSQVRSEEHTSELQSRENLVSRLLLE